MSRVLIVDNPALFRMLEATFVHRAGWDIADGRLPDEILARAQASRPDLILLDTSTPEFDTPGCIRALKSDPSGAAVPVLVLADESLARACEAAGADATLSHPVPAAALEAALCALAGVATRAGRRRMVGVPARIDTPTGRLRGRLKDISRSGAFLALPRPLPLDSTLELALRLPARDGPLDVQARGVVVRQVPEDRHSHRVAGVGVRFTGVDATSESIIDRFVSHEVEPGREAPDADEGDIE